MLKDLRFAVRMLTRARGFTATALVVLTLGIGATATMFSATNAVLFRPLPYPDADRIVVLRTTSVKTGEINPLVTLANFWDWRAQSTSFEAMATYRGGETPVSPGVTGVSPSTRGMPPWMCSGSVCSASCRRSDAPSVLQTWSPVTASRWR